MIPKRLVFHLYVYDSKDYFDNIAYKLHIQCLKRYSHVFDKSCFNIACDNINDTETINRIKHELIDCGFKNIEIIVTENDSFCEVNTFKHFISDRMGKDNDLVFFAHTKGICNVIDGVNYPENILYWIWTLYYFNLEPKYVDNMQMRIVHSYGGNQDTFYGTCRIFTDNYTASFYSGTFYWVNHMKLYEDNLRGKIRIPNMYNRNWCEELPGVYRDNDNPYKGVASYYNTHVNNGNFYEWNNWENIANILSNGHDVENYINEFKSVMNK